MDFGLVEAVCSLGVGGALAALIFIMYRKDRQSSENRLREDRIFMEDRLSGIIKEDQIGRKDNTAALVGLTTVLERMNGKK